MTSQSTLLRETDRIERIPLAETVEISVVVPHYYSSRDPNVRQLVNDLRIQSVKNIEVLIAHGISPQGKAINAGARAAKGSILVVMDDDSRIGHSRVIENLTKVIRENPDVAMAGASLVTPENANAFQREAAKQFPRFNMPVIKEIVDSDLACHGCVAFRKDVFMRAGMEREDIIRGLDPDLRVRLRKAGYRVVLAPDSWFYHPFPENFGKFIRLFYRNGYGSAYLQVVHPEMSYDTDETLRSDLFVSKRSFLYRAFRFPLRLAKAIVKFEWLRFSGYCVYLIGYLVGFIRFKFFAQQRRLNFLL